MAGIEEPIIRTNGGIREQEVPTCLLCGAKGLPLYTGMTDRLFRAAGVWGFLSCPQCGLIWLNPRPVPEDIGKVYQTYYTHQGEISQVSDSLPTRVSGFAKEGYWATKYGYYKESLGAWKKLLGMLIYFRPFFRVSLDARIMYLPAQPNGRLLEIGFGNGRTLELMKDLGWHVEGLDIDPVSVENAKGKGLSVRLGVLEAQGYPNDHFDAIIMSHLIEHVHEPLQLLRECHRILKPGGRLVLVTPNSQSWGHKIFKDSWVGLDPPRHLHLFAPILLRHIAEGMGFRKLRVSTSVNGARWIFPASRSIQRLGKHDMDGQQSGVSRLWARGMELVEWAILLARPGLGEEIALIAEK
ncbi:MAG: class I SAM-dependent methyltransferase [Candidatus Marsarchaeota archaeon]|nr:class I SAM-dependent methyltransferase [Candidatus Marsarchaeota archaeon]